MGFLNGLPDAVIQHGEGKIRLVNGVNLLQVRLGFQQPGLDGVAQTVLGSLVQDGQGFPGFPAGKGLSPAAGRRDPQGQGGLSLRWVAVNDGQFSKGDVGIPEPAHWFHHNVLQGDEFQFGLILWQITSHSFHRSQGKGGSSVFNCGKPLSQSSAMAEGKLPGRWLSRVLFFSCSGGRGPSSPCLFMSAGIQKLPPLLQKVGVAL